MKLCFRDITGVESGAGEYNGELSGFVYRNNDLAQKVNTEIQRQLIRRINYR